MSFILDAAAARTQELLGLFGLGNVGDVVKAAEQKVTEPLDKNKPPRFVSLYNIKDPTVDEILPLLIILAHRRPEVRQFYDRLMTFIVNLAKAGRTSWVGSWMGFKLSVNVLERFGLIPLGVAPSYDAGLSWAFGVASATEFLSDIKVGNIVENIFKGEKEE